MVAAGPRLRFAWQAQDTEPPGGAAARVVAAGPRLCFAWQAQDTEPPGRAAARVTIFYTPSFTHRFVTHHLSHTTLSHPFFHTQLSDYLSHMTSGSRSTPPLVAADNRVTLGFFTHKISPLRARTFGFAAFILWKFLGHSPRIDTVQGARTVFNKKMLEHYRKLKSPAKIQGLWNWALVSRGLRRAGIPIVSGTLSVEQKWSILKTMLPSQARRVSFDWWQMLADMTFLRLMYTHYHRGNLPSWTDNDSLLAQKLEGSGFMPTLETQKDFQFPERR